MQCFNLFLKEYYSTEWHNFEEHCIYTQKKIQKFFKYIWYQSLNKEELKLMEELWLCLASDSHTESYDSAYG